MEKNGQPIGNQPQVDGAAAEWAAWFSSSRMRWSCASMCLCTTRNWLATLRRAFEGVPFRVLALLGYASPLK